MDFLRLYCEPVTSASRLACQHVCFSILETILRTIAPIVPHFAEEVYSYHPLYAGEKNSKCTFTRWGKVHAKLYFVFNFKY